jgi:UDPglucose--hexose-1-phosphate uridylyltransferase
MLNFSQKSEIRKSYFLNKYAIITPVRALRPKDMKEKTIIKKDAKCPFCPKNINKDNVLSKIGQGDNWQLLCLKNIFPAVTLDNKKAYGTQEVIIETPKHNLKLADLNEKQIENVLRMHAQRTKIASKNKKIDYILCFKNQGSKAGASIAHAHSQIFASSILPPDIKEEFNLVKKYTAEKKSCPYCDIIKKETKSKRKIYSDNNAIAFTPYASEYHYEAWIFAKRHLDNITKLNDNEFKSFSRILKIILAKLQALDLSFNFFMHQVISNHNQHFYMKIQPREGVWAGIELGSGLIINTVPPEFAAEYYKKNIN